MEVINTKKENDQWINDWREIGNVVNETYENDKAENAKWHGGKW